MPALVRGAPELRDAWLYRRVFLTRHSAAFDLAVAGAALAAARCSSRSSIHLTGLPAIRAAMQSTTMYGNNASFAPKLPPEFAGLRCRRRLPAMRSARAITGCSENGP